MPEMTNLPHGPHHSAPRITKACLKIDKVDKAYGLVAIKCVKECLLCGLAEAKKIVDNVPQTIEIPDYITEENLALLDKDIIDFEIIYK